MRNHQISFDNPAGLFGFLKSLSYIYNMENMHNTNNENKIPEFIKPEGIYEPEDHIDYNSIYNYLFHKPLKFLIEHNLVFKDTNGDWVLVEYSQGVSNGEDYFYWKKTGYKRYWEVTRWKSDTNQNKPYSAYSTEEKYSGGPTFYNSVESDKYYYQRITRPSGWWSETVQDKKGNGAYGEDQLYYKDAFGKTSGKIPECIKSKIVNIS